MKNDVLLEIDNLSFTYDNISYVLDNLSLTVKKNQLVAIIGKNGCGKSTLFDCVLGFNKFNSGSIKICDKNVNEYSANGLAKKVTYVEQDNRLLLNYKVFDYLSFARNPYMGININLSNNDYKIIEMYLKKCNIEYLKNKSINNISGGERQLVNICRSLIQETELMILDEPLGALDYGNQIKIIELLFEMIKEQRTIIFSIHNPMLLIEYNIYVLVMENGHITEQGDSREILTKERINCIYNI